MTNPTTCPKCGAEIAQDDYADRYFACGSLLSHLVDNPTLRQSDACIIAQLRQQLAAVTREREALRAQITGADDLANLSD